MANLFWKTKREVKTLLPTLFNSEEDFEKTIYETNEILDDIFLLKRQIRGGRKQGIPDIIGIDSDGNVCIVEMKNIVVDPKIISQVLEYAFWAETNPDSIKSLWYECENKPDELGISWDKYEVRIIVIGPKILKSTLDIVDKINYQVDLIEITRWIEADNELLLVNKLEPEKKDVKPVSGMQIYDADFYKKKYNKKSAESFLKYCSEIESLIEQNKWQLVTKFNKHYCSFKAGFFNAFGIEFIGSKTFAFFVKLTEDEAKSIDPPMTKYSEQWKQAYYYIEPGKTKSKEYLELFEKAYRKLTG